MMRLLGQSWRLERIYPVSSLYPICCSVGLCGMGASAPVTALNNGLYQLSVSCALYTKHAAHSNQCLSKSRGYDER